MVDCDSMLVQRGDNILQERSDAIVSANLYAACSAGRKLLFE